MESHWIGIYAATPHLQMWKSIRVNYDNCFGQNFVTKCLSYVTICSQFILNYLAPGMTDSHFCFQSATKLSHISRTFGLAETKLRRFQSRQVRHTATTMWLLWEKNLSLKFVEISRDTKARPCDSSEEIVTTPRMFRDILVTPSQMSFAICRQQSQQREIRLPFSSINIIMQKFTRF